jgi:hypothetical protein
MRISNTGTFHYPERSVTRENSLETDSEHPSNYGAPPDTDVATGRRDRADGATGRTAPPDVASCGRPLSCYLPFSGPRTGLTGPLVLKLYNTKGYAYTLGYTRVTI